MSRVWNVCVLRDFLTNERGLRRALAAYVEHYLKSRAHLALNKDAAIPSSLLTLRQSALSVCDFVAVAVPVAQLGWAGGLLT
jgi:hypothetical protein